MNNLNNNVSIELAFKDFLLHRNPSQKFAEKYFTYLASSLVKTTTLEVSKVTDIFQVTDLNELNTIYAIVKANSNNVRLHNVYSGAVSAYIKFLTGKELRKRVIPKKGDNTNKIINE